MSIYLFTYRMRGCRKLSTLPVYAATLPEASSRFHRAMGAFGCDYEQYRVVSHRVIQESEIRFFWTTHRKTIDNLSPDDRQSFFEDRRARQLRQGVDQTTTEFFEMEHVT